MAETRTRTYMHTRPRKKVSTLLKVKFLKSELKSENVSESKKNERRKQTTRNLISRLATMTHVFSSFNFAFTFESTYLQLSYGTKNQTLYTFSWTAHHIPLHLIQHGICMINEQLIQTAAELKATEGQRFDFSRQSPIDFYEF